MGANGGRSVARLAAASVPSGPGIRRPSRAASPAERDDATAGKARIGPRPATGGTTSLAHITDIYTERELSEQGFSVERRVPHELHERRPTMRQRQPPLLLSLSSRARGVTRGARLYPRKDRATAEAFGSPSSLGRVPIFVRVPRRAREWESLFYLWTIFGRHSSSMSRRTISSSFLPLADFSVSISPCFFPGCQACFTIIYTSLSAAAAAEH